MKILYAKIVGRLLKNTQNEVREITALFVYTQNIWIKIFLETDFLIAKQ
jgi:hypothetical protein